jgi:pyrimidine-nucleoside phosphorylase/thymidine phosphorylase
MVGIGKSLNRDTVAVITNMDQPLGNQVGNSNEVKEAIKVLSGDGSEDETTIALTIASHMCLLGGAFKDFDSAYEKLQETIRSGKAIEKLKELISIQGGNPEVVENTDLLPGAKNSIDVKSQRDGFVYEIDAENVGISAMLLGAGRRTKEDKIDYGAGITLRKKIGDPVKKGDVLYTLMTNLDDYQDAVERMKEAYVISNEKPETKPYIYNIIK